VVAFEEIKHQFDPKDCSAFVAVSYTNLNRLRSRLYQMTKAKGYKLPSYVSSHAAIARNVEVGDNCFILENVNVQRGAKIGSNVTLWSGSSIGHRTVVRDNCFLASHVAVSGFCEVGEGSFLGVNCCLRDQVHIGKDCVVGAGAVVLEDLVGGQVYVGNPAKPLQGKTVEPFISGEETI
jgi:sugar O-acyltransferase (sialic acid O-acetyltransferase NeuD family)